MTKKLFLNETENEEIIVTVVQDDVIYTFDLKPDEFLFYDKLVRVEGDNIVVTNFEGGAAASIKLSS